MTDERGTTAGLWNISFTVIQQVADDSSLGVSMVVMSAVMFAAIIQIAVVYRSRAQM